MSGEPKRMGGGGDCFSRGPERMVMGPKYMSRAPEYSIDRSVWYHGKYPYFWAAAWKRLRFGFLAVVGVPANNHV